MVYILSQNGQPLMPTARHGKVRHLLKEGRAKVIKRCPFTIQLLYETTNYTQELTLGVDAGSKHIGVSVTSESKEYYAGEVELRNDIVNLLATRRESRRSRRNRKTRYRQLRFDNRRRGDNWLAPSIRHKVDSHLKIVERLYKTLPITRIVVETASFDLQKIKNPDVQGTDYQQGDQLGFWNVREYVLFRDATFMGIMRWAFYNELKARYPNVSMTYGYLTKNTRIRNNLEKTHCVDARCISGHPTAVPLGEYFYQRKVRRHNRQIHKANPKKGIRKRNQAPYLVHGFRLFDKVSYNGAEYFIFGRRSRGQFDIRTLDGAKVNKGSLSYKKITFLETANSYLTERRLATT